VIQLHQSVRQHTQNIAPQRLAAPEVVTLTASREDLPTPAGDDFGFFQALPLAIAGGLALWGLIVWVLL